MTGTRAPSILASQSTEMYASRRLALVTIKDTFSGYSCAGKMCHLLLAGYQDVPSFLNRYILILFLRHNSYHNFSHSLRIAKCEV